MSSIVIPRQRGGWWHNYVCPVHGTELDHVGLLTGEFPAGGAPCRHGCRWDTPEIRGAWTVLAHQECARRADLSVLKQYEELYLSLAGTHREAQPWMLPGRLFHQALTEAIWAVSIGQAARRLGNPVPALLKSLAEAARTARDTLVSRGNFRSNYVAWLNAAGAICDLAPTGGPGLPQNSAQHWQESLHEHVLAAVHPDGWEWEGSTYYHDFVLRAYEAAIENPPPEVAARLAAMGEVSATFAGTALHDSPMVTEPRLANPARSWARTFPDAGYAVVEHAGILGILDYGPHGGSHGHRDKLALYLYPWQPDPGQVPYGHKTWRDHYASTRAHPAYSVDGLEQAECAGRRIDDTTFACDEAYDGVRARRRLTRIDGGLLDELTVTCDRPRRVALHLRPAVPFAVDGNASTWTGPGRVLRGVHTATAPAEFTMRPAPGPADDPQRTVSWVDWTAHEVTEVTFRSEYRCSN